MCEKSLALAPPGFDDVVVDGQNMVDNVVIDDNGKSVGSGTRRRSNNNNRGGEL